MGHLCDKARGLANIPDEGRGERGRALSHPAAATAYEVDVVGVVGQVVAGGAVVEVGVVDDAQRFQGLQDSIDRRRREGRLTVTCHPGGDLLGGGVGKFLDSVEDAAALRGHPHAVRVKAFTEILHVLHCTFAVRRRNRPRSVDPLELGGGVALQRLADRSHVHRPHQVGADQAVETAAGVVLLGSRAAHDAVGTQLDPGR